MVWVSSVHGFRCGSVLVLVVFGQRRAVGKQCLRVSVWIGNGSRGLSAVSCCGLAVVRGLWCGSGEGCFWILVWVICGSVMEVVCGFWFGLFVGQQQRCGFWFGSAVG